jgi:hypothetical protein
MQTNGPTFNYSEFIEWTTQLVSQGLSSGANQSLALSGYTDLNLKRMLRIYKTTTINQELNELIKNIATKQTWYVITETWCGDSAQSLPVIAKIVEQSNWNIDLRIVLRDENPELMEKYHTNGSKSIPKLIAFNQNGEELFVWGPRPLPAQEILLSWKNNPQGKTWDEFEKDLHTWYAKDKTQTLQNEFYERINNIQKTKHDLRFTGGFHVN